MNSKFQLILSALILVIAVLACSPGLYVPTLADSQKSGVSVDSLMIGRKLYVRKCGSCHNLYRSEQFTRKEWYNVMPDMQKEANINKDQKEMILKYLSLHFKEEK